ncbi:MFS transporter [Kitasatospora sp. NPDC057223]|uniref:MFS transporter n=1 Tax=Kitasatospora sp. NPDC057223 TaxID=3346055 RepID=UPI0036256FEE
MTTPAPARTPGTSSRPARSPGTASALVAYAFWATMVGTTVPTPLYPLYQHDFGFSALMVTVVFAVYALGVVAGLLVLGRLSDEIGRRPVIALALLLAAGGAGLFLAADGLAWMLTARVLSGLSAALITGSATAALLDLAAPERKARAQSLAIAANMGGLACGTLMSGLLAQWAGAPLRLPWLVTLGLVAIAAAGLTLLPETGPAPAGFRLRPQALRVPSAIRPAFLRAALTAGSGFAVLGVLTAVTGLFLARVLHFEDPALTGLVVFLAFACTALGQFAARTLPSARALPVACAGLVLAATLVAVALLGESLAALLAGAAANGLATGIAVGNGLGVINAGTPPQRRGEVVSTFFAILYAMLSVPVIGVGVLIQLSGLRTAGVTFSALVAALALAVALTLRRGTPGGR